MFVKEGAKNFKMQNRYNHRGATEASLQTTATEGACLWHKNSL